jgi:hypothetical protein
MHDISLATAALIAFASGGAHADDARVTTSAVICPSKDSLKLAYNWIASSDQTDMLKDIHGLGCDILYGWEVVKILEKDNEVSKIIWDTKNYFIQSKWLGPAEQPVIRHADGTP